jgi:hypothetical protein
VYLCGRGLGSVQLRSWIVSGAKAAGLLLLGMAWAATPRPSSWVETIARNRGETIAARAIA